MSTIENYCINSDEEGTQLRLVAPNNRTSFAVHEMLGNPFGKALFTVRGLGVNPAYDYSNTVAPLPNSAVKTTKNATDKDSGAEQQQQQASASSPINSAIVSGSLDFSSNAIGSNTKVDRIAANPECSVIAIASERVLRLITSDTKQVAAEMWMEDRILNLRMNGEVLAVILAKVTHFFMVDTLQPLPELRTQWPSSNYNGLGALSCMLGSSCFFAVSQSLSDKKLRGDVFLYNPVSAQSLTVIDAHDDPIRCIEFSGNGLRFATVSNNGRKIRIWTCPDCVPLHELQRGQSEAIIYSVGMNFDASILALTSNSGTLHCFRPQVNNRSISKINGKTSHSLCYLSPDGQYLFVLYPPDANSKTAKLERHKLSHDLKSISLDTEINLTV